MTVVFLSQVHKDKPKVITHFPCPKCCKERFLCWPHTHRDLNWVFDSKITEERCGWNEKKKFNYKFGYSLKLQIHSISFY